MIHTAPRPGTIRRSLSLVSFKRSARALRSGVPALLAIALAACGGGGGGGDAAPAPGGNGGGWQAGVFSPAETFAAQCAAPRSGTDPATNQPFEDVQGTSTDENNFLRSYSDDTYLWYDEITDQNPGLFDDPLVYFDELMTFETTASGQPKDRFHFTVDSEEWFQLSQSGISAGYGATWFLLSASPPREVLVAYTEPNSPATAAGTDLTRGARVLSVDGVDIDDNTQADIDALNAGLFPADAGETHTFQIQDRDAQTTRSITMVSENVTSAPVQNVRVTDTPSGRVGYLLFNDHIATAEGALIDAVNQLSAAPGIDDLVLDLRYNGGGFLDIASEFSYMIAGANQTGGRTFEVLQFNDKHPSTNPITGQPLSPTPFHATTQGFSVSSGQPLPTLDLSRVFVLTSSATCSASESIMNSLRGVNVEVIQIGTTTCGKPYGFFATDNCGTTYFTIQFRGINEVNFGDYTDGFSPANATSNIGTTIPGCMVADDFSLELGDPGERRYAAALNYRETQTCPAPSAFTQPGLGKSNGAADAVEGYVYKSPWLKNRILRR